MIVVFSLFKNIKMKRLFYVLTMLIVLSSCLNSYSPREIDNLVIKQYPFYKTSVRAIKAIDSNQLYYAAADGSHGIISEYNNSNKKYNIRYKDSIIPNFRSLASNGKDFFALSIGNPALLYKINDGKATLVYKEENEKVFYDSLKFFDEQNGIAMGDPTEDCLSIITTSDGGNSWQKIPCSELPKTEPGEAAFAASNTNIKIINKTVWIATGGLKARVFKSSDMGKTWSVFNTPIVQGKSSQGIYSMDFADENHGIIIGGDYTKPQENINNKAITVDGGKTWTIVANGQIPNYKSCVQYIPNTKGKELIAVGKTGVSFSNDGGNSWKDVSSDSYYTIDFINEKMAWLAGNQKIGKLILP